MNKQWQPAQTPTVPDSLRDAVKIGISPLADELVAQILAGRGISTADDAHAFMYPDRYIPASPYDLPDMDKAIARIQQALENRENILIWGDFDVDGQTATALWTEALTALSGQVAHYIPNRAQGHGVHPSILEKMLMGEWKDGFIPQLVITCDTGIVAYDAVALAGRYDVPMIITDHHQLGATLPPAHAVINPQRLPADHPAHTLPGVGVVYLCVQALYQAQGISAEALTPFLDLVALGIVADVAVQRGDTRYLLQKGLAILQSTPRLGLQVLYELADVTPDLLNEETIGFVIAPRLNSLGRLDDAGYAVEFLTTSDLERARILANRLETLNADRKLLSDQIFMAAMEQTHATPPLAEAPIVILGHEKWHGGVIGVVANRLVEHFGKPVILFTFADGVARGSARSINGVDITACISACADLLMTYGGHTMAAGVSLSLDNLPAFRREMGRVVRDQLKASAQPETPTLTINAFIPLAELTLDFISTLDCLRPFGAGNPPLMLASERLVIRNFRQIGKSKEHLRVMVEDETGRVQDVLWWRTDPDALPQGKFDLAYTANMNTYKGEKQVQVTWADFRYVEGEEPLTQGIGSIRFTDYRHLSEGEATAELILLGKDVLIWNEGEAVIGVQSVRRQDLHPAPILAIWTAPPSHTVLSEALAQVKPREVVLFGVNPRADSMQGFLNRLGSTIKDLFAKDTIQTIPIETLAGTMAQSAETVLAGIAWMSARGHLTRISQEAGMLTLRYGGDKAPDHHTTTTTRLAHLLQETAAYRVLFKTLETEKFPQ